MRNDIVVIIIINLKIYPLPSVFQLLVGSALISLHLTSLDIFGDHRSFLGLANSLGHRWKE